MIKVDSGSLATWAKQLVKPYYTQAAAARATGLDRSTINKWVNGQAQYVQLETLQKMAAIGDRDVDELLAELQTPTAIDEPDIEEVADEVDQLREQVQNLSQELRKMKRLQEQQIGYKTGDRTKK